MIANKNRTLKFLIKGAASLIIVGSLVACSTMSNRFSPNRITSAQIEDQTNGIVIISTGADEKCISFATFLGLHNKGARYHDVKAQIPVDVYALKSDQVGTFGFINAFVLPAGSYYLSPWLSNPRFVAKRSPRYDFDVAAGEITYLGQYHQPGRCVVGEGQITDQWHRDREMIAERNPYIDVARTKTRLLRYSGDAVTGEDGPSAERYNEVSPAIQPPALEK